MPPANSLSHFCFDKLENKRLNLTIAALSRHPDHKGVKAVLFESLLESTLLLVTGEPIRRPNSGALLLNSDGLAHYEPGSRISLVLLADAEKKNCMAVFTSAAALKRLGLDDRLFALALPATEALEIFLASPADYFCINPGSPERVEIERETLHLFVKQLRCSGLIPETNLVERDYPEKISG